MTKTNFNSGEHLYLQVSDGIEKMIGDEVLRTGDKLPSVRNLSREYGISPGTAFQAYYRLEGMGLIESRPKSGYYVRVSHRRLPEMPETAKPDTAQHDVSVAEMIGAVYKEINAGKGINFALAVPDPLLLPAAKIKKSVMHALRSNEDHCVNYEISQGNTELRKEIAKLSFNWGGKVKADEVIVTGGCLEAITLCLRAVTEYGDTVAVESPTYFGLYQAIESLGLKVIGIASDPVTGMDPGNLRKAISKFPVKACVVIPNFNNPTGSCMPDENKKALVQMLAEKNIPLIEDDIYGELYFGNNRPKTCKYYDKKGLVLHCSSLSKSLSPGYRIGWVIPGKFFETVARLKRIHNISCPTLTQAAIAHYLHHGRFEYHLKNLRKALHTQCLHYMRAIIEYFPADTKISRPHGGFILWLQLNKKVDAFKLRAEALKHDIHIVPGKIFSSGTGFSNCIRISFGKQWSCDAEYGIMMLGKMIKKMI